MLRSDAKVKVKNFVSVSTQNGVINPWQTPGVPREVAWRFSVQQYHRMICLSILTEEKPTYQRRKDYSLSDEVTVAIAGREVGRITVQDLLPY